MKRAILILFVLTGWMLPAVRSSQDPTGQTEITKWPQDKRAAVSLTFDDNSVNQFRVAVPIMDRLGLPATFHIITGDIAGSRYHAMFIGRPIQAIIQETAGGATNADNFFERASAIGHLGLQGTLEYHSRAGELYEEGKVSEAYRLLDEAYAKVRGGAFAPEPAAPATADRRNAISWDDLKKLAARGYEFSSHTVTHPRLAVLDEANLVYELDKSREEILNHLGTKHTFTVECPYGTEDERVLKYVLARYPASRNRMPEPFLEELNRGSEKDPGASGKEYVQWQRGVLTKTPMTLMKSWVDTVAAHDNMWLVLVFHGVDGVGWEPTTGAELAEYFGYIKSRDDRVWAATFGDVTKYLRERMRSTVHTSRNGDVIEVALRHDLADERYDLPLTLKTYVPAVWTAVEVRQGTGFTRASVLRDGRGSYVLYQARPNAEPIRLKRGIDTTLTSS
jgi:peptidoglycan/xylan/chitin deacetylase (PgdA/CDA1 family)